MDKTWYMAGTEGTGTYMVLVMTSKGRIGLRVLNTGCLDLVGIGAARIRVEPADGVDLSMMQATLPASGRRVWKQPGENDQNRFSTVVQSSDAHGRALKAALTAGFSVLGTDEVMVNPDLPKWAKGLVMKHFQTGAAA